MWRNGTLVSFDTETTGTNPETARIVTASVVVIRPGEQPRPVEWLVDPGVEIPEQASKIHGITTEQARDAGMPAAAAVGEIAETIEACCVDDGVPLIVYNASYDLTLLDRELRRHFVVGSALSAIPRVVDPLVIDRALDRYRKGKRTLTETSKHYRVPISEQDAHGSTADALCAARVAWKLAGVFPEELADLEALQGKQARWHANWVDHFADYQRSLGRVLTDISRDWPVRAVPELVPT